MRFEPSQGQPQPCHRAGLWHSLRAKTGRRCGGMDLKAHIRQIPDFPKPGILFYDISTLLAHAEAWKWAIAEMAEIVARRGPGLLAGIESRGFVFAAPVAAR